MKKLVFILFFCPLSIFCQKVIMAESMNGYEIYTSFIIAGGGIDVYKNGDIDTFSNVYACKIWFEKRTNLAEISEIEIDYLSKSPMRSSNFQMQLFEKMGSIYIFKMSENTYFFFSQGVFWGRFNRVNSDGDVINNLTLHGQVTPKLIKELINFGIAH